MTEFHEPFWPGQIAPDFLMPGPPGTHATFTSSTAGGAALPIPSRGG